jgi:hypothetical protein
VRILIELSELKSRKKITDWMGVIGKNQK